MAYRDRTLPPSSDSPRRGADPVTSLADAGWPAAAPRRLDSAALLGGAREVLICHRGVEYRLRHTGLGKLILTK